MASMTSTRAFPVASKIGGRVSGASRAALAHSAPVLSFVAACIHLWAAPGHFHVWWGHGVFFLLAAMSQGLYAVVLLRWPTKAVYAAGVFVNLSLVSVCLATNAPAFGAHAGHAARNLDIAGVSVGLALVAILVFLSGSMKVASRFLASAFVCAFGSGIVLHSIQSGGSFPVSGWIEGSVLAIPAAVLCLVISAFVSRRLSEFFYGKGTDGFFPRLLWTISASSLFAAASIPANGLDGAGVVLMSSFAILFAVAAVRGVPWEDTREINLRHPRTLTALAGTIAAVAVLASPAIFGGVFAPPAEAQSVPGTCDASSYDHSYDVAAVNVRVPYNRWGGMDPHGQAFVLQGDKAAVKNWSEPLAANPADDPAGNRRLRPRPLVIRANVGDCVKVDFRNELNAQGEDGLPNNPRASMKVFGPSYDAQTSDGSAVGYNEDTTVAIGESITYFWKVPEQEGIYLFRDQGATSGSEANSGSLGHGLYGALAVEPEGSTWLDPTTGDPIYDGARDHRRVTKESGDPYIDADIAPPGASAFRETVQISQDELPGGQGFGFNYGAEPGFNRIATNPAGEGGAEDLAPDAIGEETSLSSWTYGDPSLIKLASGEGPWLPEPNPDKPGTRYSPEDCGLEEEPGGSCYVSNVVHSYPGDPTKIRYAHAGVKETHVFHMHAHQWLAEPNDVGDSGAPSGEITDANRPDSNTIDSQTYGPGETFTADLLYGAGSKPGTIGDSIFHCHLYPHFADGFWALFRVHDVIEDGTMSTPDGVKVRPLAELPGRTDSAPAATAENPGYPRFMPGEFGWRAPQPPGGISESIPDDPNTPADESADDPDTVEREDLAPGKRVVAGRQLDPTTLDPDDDPATDPLSASLADKLELEESAQNLHYTGDANSPANSEPGAPFTDPCPSGSREVTYNVSVIQADVTYNEAGWHDKQGRILVLDEDVDEILSGEKNPDPLFIRVNAGDCVNFNLTNRLPNFFGNDEFVQLAQTNMVGEHIHLVKFDVMGSDGSSNGWNYQQAAFTREQMDFKNNAVNGRVQNCDWNECRIQTPDPATFDPEAEAAEAGANPGQTIHERWFADYELRTVFTHDHHFPALDQNRGLFGAMIVEPNGTDFRNPRTGEYYQPINAPAHTNASDSIPTNDEVCAGADNACNANAAGTAMDVIGPQGNDDFREFGLAVQDFVSLHRSDADGGAAIQAPVTPESFPDDDPGVMGVNYRNAPFVLRNTKNGRPTDPAHVFSSTVHGDPETPVFEAYTEDPVRMRVIQGSQEEQHVMTVHGVRWPQEPDDPESPIVNTQAVGISEAFNFQIPRFTCAANDSACAGDYLYSATATDDMYLGVWGLIRARGRQISSLLPLPDNAPPTSPTSASAPTATPPQPDGGPSSSTGLAPPEANAPGTPCPTNAPIRKYNVVAMDADIEYNKHGDHDPFGLIYALASDEAAIRSGEKKPEPLTIRANEGECIEVRLTNKVSQSWLSSHPRAGTDGDPTLPTEPAAGTPSGLRVSLHPQLVKYDVRGSDGTAVGYNRDQSVGVGDTKLYRWFADDAGVGEIGATNLMDFGDVRGHRHHGLFAALNIEPANSTHHDPQTGDEIQSGESADIRVPGPDNDFREFSLFYQDGLNLHDENGPIEDEPDHPPTPEEPEGEGLDPEDQGEKGFNYGNAPFDHRLPPEVMGPDGIHPLPRDGQAMSDVFNSRVHGDPDTPIFRAFAGDPVRMRVLQGSDKPRQHTFQVSGHSWVSQPGDPGSTIIGTQGGMSVGRSFNAEFAASGFPGDYRYGSGVGFHHISGGLWGIMRLYPQMPLAEAISPTPIPETDDPRAGGHPILPLEVAASESAMSFRAEPASVEAGGSTTLSGALEIPGVGGLSGREVIIEQRLEGATGWQSVPDGTLTTGGGGSFTLENVSPSKSTDYRATFAGQPGVGVGGATSEEVRVEVKGGVSIGLSTSEPTVVYGQSVTLSGSLASDEELLSGERVVIEQKSHGEAGFAPVPEQPSNGVLTDGDGEFELPGVRPEKNTEYRAVFAGGSGLAASESTPVNIDVKALVSVKTSSARVKVKKPIVISGEVKPVHGGDVRVTIRGGPKPVVKNVALANSRYSLRYKPPRAGKYTVSVSFAGDADHLGNTSPSRSFNAAR